MTNREADKVIAAGVSYWVISAIFFAVITSPITWWISGIVFVVWLFKR